MQSFDRATAHDNLARAVLRSITADHYGDDASPHADVSSEYAAELVALAARELVRAVDAEPWDRQPIGWGDRPKPDAGMLDGRDLITAMGGLAACTAAPFGFPVSAADESVTTSQAAGILGVSRATLVRFLNDGRLPYTTPGKHRRIRLADVLAFKAQVTHESATASEERAR